MEVIVVKVEGEEGGALVTGVVGAGISPFAVAELGVVSSPLKYPLQRRRRVMSIEPSKEAA